jgi:hypothetical protein
MQRRGAPEPKPLRSSEYPWGLPGLEGRDRIKVETANSVYKFIAEFMTACCLHDVYFYLENPRNSYFWHIPPIVELTSRKDVIIRTCQACMLGSKRDKWTSFATNIQQSSALDVVCDGSHEHAPWGYNLQTKDFNTKLESEYPAEMCDLLSSILFQLASSLGVAVAAISTASKQITDPTKPVRAKLAIMAGRQPRSQLIQPIISEYEQIMTVPISAEQYHEFQRLVGSKLPKDFVSHDVTVPKDSKVLELRRSGGGVIGTQHKESAADASNVESFKMVVGVYHSPDSFINKALKLDHPFDHPANVKDVLSHAMFKLLTEGPEKVCNDREAALEKYNRISRSLSKKEAELHASLPECMQKVLHGKSLLLLQRMAKDAGYDDPFLAQDAVLGASITGISRDCAEFPNRPSDPTMTAEDVMKATRWSRKVIINSVKSSGDINLDKELHDITREERERGWLQGPFTEQELKDKLGPLYVVNRRFGLKQSDKIRPIDDYSESFPNSAYGCPFKLDLGGIDELTTIARQIVCAVEDDRKVSITLASGRVLTGTLHSSLSVHQARQVVGRTLDLDSAYKQLATAMKSRWACVQATYNPESQKAELDISVALPFGAKASVFPGIHRFSNI